MQVGNVSPNRLLHFRLPHQAKQKMFYRQTILFCDVINYRMTCFRLRLHRNRQNYAISDVLHQLLNLFHLKLTSDAHLFACARHALLGRVHKCKSPYLSLTTFHKRKVQKFHYQVGHGLKLQEASNGEQNKSGRVPIYFS